MKYTLRNVALAVTSLLLVSMFGSAQATDTNVVLNLEGNPTCSSLGDNANIIEIRDNDPIVGVTRIATADLIDSLGQVIGQQQIEYTIDADAAGNGVVSWEILNFDLETVNPINYTILKARGNAGAKVFHFGGEGAGAVADSGEIANGELTAVSFCYGLAFGFTPPTTISLSNLPTCESIDTDGDGVPGDLFTTGIVCPEGTGAEEQLIINMNINAPNFGFDFKNDQVRACTCNVELKACNPELAAVPAGTQDGLSAEERSCMEYDANSLNDRGIPDGVNDRVPFVIMGVENPDSYICYDIGGTRYCYGHY